MDASLLPQRVLRASGLVLGIVVVGTVGFYTLTHAVGMTTTVEEALYMTVITITTVGFREIVPVASLPGGRIFVMVILMAGMGSFLYLASSATALIVEGDIMVARRLRKMQKQIDELTDHFIVCGVGKTGIHVAEELLLTERAFVAIDASADAFRPLLEHARGNPPLTLEGDATEDGVLEAAGVRRAQGLVATLPSDKDNLFCVISAREFNPKMKIVARAIDPHAAQKLRKAGADAIVETNRIGGQRIVSELVRPQVVEFLELMLRDKDRNLRVEEIEIPQGSRVSEIDLRDADIRDKDSTVLVVAVYDRTKETYVYAPGPDFTLHAGQTLICIGEPRGISQVRRLVRPAD